MKPPTIRIPEQTHEGGTVTMLNPSKWRLDSPYQLSYSDNGMKRFLFLPLGNAKATLAKIRRDAPKYQMFLRSLKAVRYRV